MIPRWLKALFARKRPTAARPRVAVRLGLPPVRASYDAAETGPENVKHWRGADGLSAKGANDAETRKTLRERARHEVANNSIAKGAVLAQANDTVGTGPRLQVLGENRDFARQVERAFHDWWEAVGLTEKLRTMKQAKTVDGEPFALLTTNDLLPTSVKLDVQPVECDQITTPFWYAGAAPLVDGIELDAAGNPEAYHLLDEHPGDSWTLRPPRRIPARQMIHWFRKDRCGQARGVPELTPALPLFALLRRFTLATVQAAETAACFAALLESSLTPEDGDVELAPFDAQEIERNLMTALPAGYKMAQLKPEHPASTYEMFKREILREIGACLNLPQIVLANSAADYNFASGRLDLVIRHRAAVRVEREHCECIVLDRVFRAWLEEAVMVPGLLPAGATAETLEQSGWRWHWPAVAAAIDPLKEQQAVTEGLANGTLTLADVEADLGTGQDWEDKMRQRAKEAALAAELGLPAPGQPPAAPAPADDPAEAVAASEKKKTSAPTTPTSRATKTAASGKAAAGRRMTCPRRSRRSATSTATAGKRTR